MVVIIYYRNTIENHFSIDIYSMLVNPYTVRLQFNSQSIKLFKQRHPSDRFHDRELRAPYHIFHTALSAYPRTKSLLISQNAEYVFARQAADVVYKTRHLTSFVRCSNRQLGLATQPAVIVAANMNASILFVGLCWLQWSVGFAMARHSRID